MAFDRPAESRAQDNTIPSKHFRFERRLVQYELKYTHAEEDEKKLVGDKHCDD